MKSREPNFIRLEKDRNDSNIFMQQFVELVRQKALQELEDFHTKLKQLNVKLDSTDDKKIIENTKRDIRTIQFKIKTLTDNIEKDQIITQKKLDEWNTINLEVQTNRENAAKKVEEYYVKKNVNEMTDNEIIRELLVVEPRDLIRMNPSIDEVQGTRLDMAKYINDSEINKGRYYDDVFTDLRGVILTEFENESLAFQTGMPTDKIIPRPANMNDSIERVFEKILPVQKTFHVYRCYYSDVSVDFIDKQRKIGRPLSTSLSYNYSYEWACSERSHPDKVSNTDTGNIIICIIIPKGTHVIPLHHYTQKYEYEVLLSSEGKLCFTGERDPVHNIPIFIYFDSYKQCSKYNAMKSHRLLSPRTTSRPSFSKEGVAIKTRKRTTLSRNRKAKTQKTPTVKTLTRKTRSISSV